MDLARLTLREWYDGSFVHLFQADARPRTIEQYQVTLNVWARVTGDPPIAAIDQLILAKFRAECPGRPATIAKHARHLNHLFAKLGPPGPRNRDALGLLPAAPWCKPPRSEGKTPRVPPTEEVNDFVANAPLDLALFAVVAATTGTRNTAIRSLTSESIDLNNQLIRFPAHTDKRRRERIKPIPRPTLDWLSKHHALMERWRTGAPAFARRWNRHAKASGAPALRPHGLKRWWAAALIRAGASPWCVKFALDHAQKDVTGIHYLQPFDELAGLVDKIGLPPAFTTRLRTQTQYELPW